MDESRRKNFLKMFQDRHSRILLGVSVACCVGMLAFAVAYGTAYSSVAMLSALNRDTLTDNDYLTKAIMDNIEVEKLVPTQLNFFLIRH
jgi:hypothetical protein